MSSTFGTKTLGTTKPIQLNTKFHVDVVTKLKFLKNQKKAVVSQGMDDGKFLTTKISRFCKFLNVVAVFALQLVRDSHKGYVMVQHTTVGNECISSGHASFFFTGTDLIRKHYFALGYLTSERFLTDNEPRLSGTDCRQFSVGNTIKFLYIT